MKSFTQKLAAKLKYTRKTPYTFEEKKNEANKSQHFMDHLLKKDAEQYSRFYCYITIDYFKAKSENKLILSAQFHSHFISNYRVC